MTWSMTLLGALTGQCSFKQIVRHSVVLQWNDFSHSLIILLNKPVSRVSIIELFEGFFLFSSRDFHVVLLEAFRGGI